MHRAVPIISSCYVTFFFAVLLVFACPVKTRATTIITTATGSLSQTTQPPPQAQSDYQIMSDDHSYNAAERAQTESRPWTFNVTLDPTFEQLLDSDSLKSAVLTLTLKPELESTNSDTVIIQDLSDIDAPEHRSLLAQATTTIEVELLNVYSGKDLLEVFKNHAGKLPISYHHPEKISSIQLRLTTEVPDKKKLFIGGGIAFILCMAGGVGYVSWRRKKYIMSCPPFFKMTVWQR